MLLSEVRRPHNGALYAGLTNLDFEVITPHNQPQPATRLLHLSYRQTKVLNEQQRLSYHLDSARLALPRGLRSK